MRTLPLLLLAACAAPPLGPAPIEVGDGGLRLELVRWAGRMTALAWVDDERNLVFQTRLIRPSFRLPVRYTKAEEYYRGLVARTGSKERAAELFVENRDAIDALYEAEVPVEFEKFWKIGPFATPEDIDRSFALDERLAEPGLHRLQIAVEPDTVSWSVTFRLMRGDRLLASYDIDPVTRLTLSGNRYLFAPVLLRTSVPK